MSTDLDIPFKKITELLSVIFRDRFKKFGIRKEIADDLDILVVGIAIGSTRDFSGN